MHTICILFILDRNLEPHENKMWIKKRGYLEYPRQSNDLPKYLCLVYCKIAPFKGQTK